MSRRGKAKRDVRVKCFELLLDSVYGDATLFHMCHVRIDVRLTLSELIDVCYLGPESEKVYVNLFMELFYRS